MLNEVLEYLNNYFIEYDTSGNKKYSYTKDLTFTAPDTITASDFSDTYQAGEYIKIDGTRLNDGVYKIVSIDSTTITIDATLDIAIDDESEVSALLTKSYIPKNIVGIISEINTYNSNVTTGISSETQGNRSVTYSTDSTGAQNWQSAFKSRLAKYKKLRWC